MDVDKIVTEGFKLNLQERGLLIRAGMVLLVAVHIAWVCGWLATFGLAAPFVKAGELKAVVQTQVANFDSRIAELEDQVSLEELRKQKAGNEWGEVDELKLSQLKRRLASEKKKMAEAEQRVADMK